MIIDANFILQLIGIVFCAIPVVVAFLIALGYLISYLFKEKD